MPWSSFSDFFRKATPAEKEEVFLQAAREASEEQRKLMQESFMLDLQRLKIIFENDQQHYKFCKEIINVFPSIVAEIEELESLSTDALDKNLDLQEEILRLRAENEDLKGFDLDKENAELSAYRTAIEELSKSKDVQLTCLCLEGSKAHQETHDFWCAKVDAILSALDLKLKN